MKTIKFSKNNKWFFCIGYKGEQGFDIIRTLNKVPDLSPNILFSKAFRCKNKNHFYYFHLYE